MAEVCCEGGAAVWLGGADDCELWPSRLCGPEVWLIWLVGEAEVRLWYSSTFMLWLRAAECSWLLLGEQVVVGSFSPPSDPVHSSPFPGHWRARVVGSWSLLEAKNHPREASLPA